MQHGTTPPVRARRIIAIALFSASSLLLAACSNQAEDGGGGANLGATSGSSSVGQGGAGGGGGSLSASTAGVGGSGGGLGGAGGIGGAGGAGGQPCPAAAGPQGQPDVDDDGDGWTELDGDCCEDGAVCGAPQLVNPGAFEIAFDCLDNDCNPNTPDDMPTADCGGSALSVPVTATKLTKALDLCQFTVEAPPLSQKTWGVISTQLTLADGAGAPKDPQLGLLADYGPNVHPQSGATMVALSSGAARDEAGGAHPESGGVPFQVGGYDALTAVPMPAAYLAANGGAVPLAPACGTCAAADCTTAYDSVAYKVRVRVPTNAVGFTFDAKFYTSEFPFANCGPYSDRFLALYDSTWQPAPGMLPLPADKNIALDLLGHPFNYSQAYDVCEAPPGSPPGTCPLGTGELVGTGMGGFPINGQVNLADGAGTPWAVIAAPAVPGETIELTFHVWDSGGHGVDSLVLLDNFRWVP